MYTLRFVLNFRNEVYVAILSIPTKTNYIVQLSSMFFRLYFCLYLMWLAVYSNLRDRP